MQACMWGSRQPLFLGYPLSIPLQPDGTRSTHPACPSSASKTAKRVRERRQAEQIPRSRGPDPARVLTSKICEAKSAASILELVAAQVDNNVFNDFHLSAAFTRLAKLSKRRQLGRADRGSSVWPRLVARLHSMLREDKVRARPAANVFWALGELYDKVDACNEALVIELSKYVQQKASAMKAQELSNCLLCVAKLGDSVPKVTVAAPNIAECILKRVDNMVPQDLSNNLWAAAKLQDAVPEVLAAVAAIAARIPKKVEDMVPQALSNCLWAAAKLQDAVPEVLTAIPAIRARIPDKVADMVPQALSNSLWAAAKLQDAVPEVLQPFPPLRHVSLTR